RGTPLRPAAARGCRRRGHGSDEVDYASKDREVDALRCQGLGERDIRNSGPAADQVLRRAGGSCNLQPGSVKVDAAYIAANGPVVREQLQKAGVRLAHLLDAALGK